MLVSNLTASSAACSALLSLKIPVISDSRSSVQLYPTQSRCGTCTAPVPYPPGDPHEMLALPLLVDAFVHGAQVDPTADPTTQKRKGELHFLSSVFANLTVVCPLVPQKTMRTIIVITDTNRSYILLDSSMFKRCTAKRRPRISSGKARSVHGTQRYNTQGRSCFKYKVMQLIKIKSGFTTYPVHPQELCIQPFRTSGSPKSRVFQNIHTTICRRSSGNGYLDQFATSIGRSRRVRS